MCRKALIFASSVDITNVCLRKVSGFVFELILTFELKKINRLNTSSEKWWNQKCWLMIEIDTMKINIWIQYEIIKKKQYHLTQYFMRMYDLVECFFFCFHPNWNDFSSIKMRTSEIDERQKVEVMSPYVCFSINFVNHWLERI
jgi:hypothetical protein